MAADELGEISVGRPRPGREETAGAAQEPPVPAFGVVGGVLQRAGPKPQCGIGEPLSPFADPLLAPARGVGDLSVHLQGAGVIDVGLPLERAVGEPSILGGEGQVAERVHQRLVEPLGAGFVGNLGGEQLEPLFAGCRREDMLDGELRPVEVGRLRRSVALLRAAEHVDPLRVAPGPIERARTDAAT